jgi:hypothetical protein
MSSRWITVTDFDLAHVGTIPGYGTYVKSMRSCRRGALAFPGGPKLTTQDLGVLLQRAQVRDSCAENCGPFGEVFIVGDACLSLVEQAGCDACSQ